MGDADGDGSILGKPPSLIGVRPTIPCAMTYGLHRTESHGLRIFRWTTAAVFTALVHVGGALALMHWRDEDVADISGSIALELAPELMAAPPMLYAESQQAEAKRVKEAAEETPTVAPSPLAPKPEVEVPLREEEKEKPKEKDREITSKQDAPEIHGDPMTTAPPPSEAKLSPVPAAPAPGISASVAKAEATWRNELVAHINRFKHYPKAALAHHVHGVVTLEFTVDHAGYIVACRVTRSSGSALLDDEAMSLLKRSVPLPTPPPQDSRAIFDFTLPISFQMR
jgi:periplasmic protein TonB